MLKPTLNFSAILLTTVLFSGCASAPNYGYQMPVSNTGMGTLGQAAMGSVVNNAIGGMSAGQGGLMNAIIQSMAASVLNGQIGQQLQPGDQDFRLQQLSNLTQSGSFDQSVQWNNPQTGNRLAINPLGNAAPDPYTQQTCRNLEEIYTLSNGQQIREPRRACQSPDGKWAFVQ